MNLYPVYFAAILGGAKHYEGRAYDHASPKRYHDIRAGDTIVFSLDRDAPNWTAQCGEHGLAKDARMTGKVGEVLFAPSVHSMFQFTRAIGQEFQPMTNGRSELLELQRAAAYYTFHSYVQRIRDHGFLGIEVLGPQLI